MCVWGNIVQLELIKLALDAGRCVQVLPWQLGSADRVGVPYCPGYVLLMSSLNCYSQVGSLPKRRNLVLGGVNLGGGQALIYLINEINLSVQT